MVSKELTIINKLGLHARAAAKFVSLASSFDSEIQVAKDGKTVNGKSIMGIMMLAASQNTRIIVSAEGNDEKLAIKIDDVVRKTKKDNWRGNKIKERQVENAIKKIISNEEEADRIFELVKNQQEY